jgi:MFS family permease
MNHKIRSNFFAMAVAAAVIMVMFASTTLPSPLYPLYRKAFGFSGLMLTLIYAVYVFGNLVSLLIFGRLSDQIGRRVTVLPAIGLAIASTLVFIFAHGTFWLFPARVLNGLANALAIGTITAWLTELHPSQNKAVGATVAIAANVSGLAIGPLLSGFLAQAAPWPLRLPWLIYLGMLIVITIFVLRVPETVRERTRRWCEIALRPRIGVPEGIRLPFIAPAATAFATFALLGFYFALIPSLLIHDLHQKAPLVAGAVLFELSSIIAIITVATHRLSSRASMFGGLILLIPSLALLILAQVLHAMPMLLGAAALAGIASAMGYRGSLEVVNEISPDARRSEVVSAYTVFCFVGNAIPVIGVGVLSVWVSSLIAHIVFAGVIALLAICAFAIGMRFSGASHKHTADDEIEE